MNFYKNRMFFIFKYVLFYQQCNINFYLLLLFQNITQEELVGVAGIFMFDIDVYETMSILLTLILGNNVFTKMVLLG